VTQRRRCLGRREFLRAATAASTVAVVTARRHAFAAETPPLTFSSTTGSTGFMTQVIRRLGLEQTYGVKLDVKTSQPSEAEKMVLLKQVQVGLMPVISAADFNLKGQLLTVFCPNLLMHGFLMTWADSPYQKLADLRGKRIGTLDKVSGLYRGMQVLAAREGMDFERDFNVVTAPPPALMAFLERKQADAIVIYEPLVSKLLAEGKFRAVMGMNDEWRKRSTSDWLFEGIAAYADWLDRNRDVAKRVAAMCLDANRNIRKNPDLVEAEADFLGLKTKAEIDLARQRVPRFFPTEWNEAGVKDVMDVVGEAVKLGQIKQVPSREFVVLLK
jgi:ABC-type nitrate/sulfonate/bicarbonate transport system substrate-binding protein